MAYLECRNEPRSCPPARCTSGQNTTRQFFRYYSSRIVSTFSTKALKTNAGLTGAKPRTSATPFHEASIGWQEMLIRRASLLFYDCFSATLATFVGRRLPLWLRSSGPVLPRSAGISYERTTASNHCTSRVPPVHLPAGADTDHARSVSRKPSPPRPARPSPIE
jgi:hypothetical protein